MRIRPKIALGRVDQSAVPRNPDLPPQTKLAPFPTAKVDWSSPPATAAKLGVPLELRGVALSAPVSEGPSQQSLRIDDLEYRAKDQLLLDTESGQVPVEIVGLYGEKIRLRELDSKPWTVHDLGAGDVGKLSPIDARAPGETVFEDALHSTVSFEETSKGLAVRIAGRQLRAGDGVKIDGWSSQDDYISTAQIRDIKLVDGEPRVFVDELMRPERLRTRMLTGGEVGRMGYDDFADEAVRPLLADRAPLTVDEVGFGGHPSFVNDGQTFYAGETVQLDGASARILQIATKDDGRPNVSVRGDDGVARFLSNAEVAAMTLDLDALDARRNYDDPRPKAEVVRVAGAEPFVLMGEDAVGVGELMVAGGHSGQAAPLRVVSIDDDDQVWVDELVPLGDKATPGPLELDGKTYAARVTPELEQLRRPLMPHESVQSFTSFTADKYSTRFDLGNLEDALSRAHTAKGEWWGYEKGVHYVRDQAVAPGDALTYRRGGAEQAMTFLGIHEPELPEYGTRGYVPLRVEVEGEEKILDVADTLFLFPCK